MVFPFRKSASTCLFYVFVFAFLSSFSIFAPSRPIANAAISAKRFYFIHSSFCTLRHPQCPVGKPGMDGAADVHGFDFHAPYFARDGEHLLFFVLVLCACFVYALWHTGLTRCDHIYSETSHQSAVVRCTPYAGYGRAAYLVAAIQRRGIYESTLMML